MPDDEKQLEAQGQNAAGGEQSGKGVPFHEHPRWKEVHGELKEWKKLGGNPGEIAARLQEAQELKSA